MQALGRVEAPPALKELNLRVEKKVRIYPLKRKTANFILGATFLASLVIFNLSQRAIIAQDVLRIERIKAFFQQEKTHQEKLFLKAARLNSPRQIEKIALRELGMITPTKINYIILPPDFSEGASSSPSPNPTLANKFPFQNPEKKVIPKPR